MKLRFRTPAACFLLIGSLLITIGHAPVMANPAAGLELGYGSGIAATNLQRILLQIDNPRLSTSNNKLSFLSLIEFSAGLWDGDKMLINLGATPIFRLQPARMRQVTPFFEGAVGIHYISHTKLHTRNLATNFQFGDHLALGFRVDTRPAFEICYKFQHLSNGSLKQPNAGINFHTVRVLFAF